MLHLDPRGKARTRQRQTPVDRSRRLAEDRLLRRLVVIDAARRFGWSREEVGSTAEVVFSTLSRARVGLGEHGGCRLVADKDRYRHDLPIVYTLLRDDRREEVGHRGSLDHAIWLLSQPLA